MYLTTAVPFEILNRISSNYTNHLTMQSNPVSFMYIALSTIGVQAHKNYTTQTELACFPNFA